MQTDATDTPDTPRGSGTSGTRGPADAEPWRRAVLAGAILVGLALGSTAVVMSLADDGAPADDVADAGRVDPEAVEGTMPEDTVMPGGGMALCAETYSPATLAEREVAFAGTVTAIDGDSITFAVAESFRGDLGETATLAGAEFMTSPNPDNPTPVGVGDRLLVAGDGGFVWGCGFTQPYDEGVAGTWRGVFGG